ncbi:MAG TPA: mannitol dehydrogenase family protein [Bauldia sp.]|nr:mannitol dehydrogenase family protein [Bauldia sp.]
MGLQTPILQFGTSRFLQAHADLFISDAMAAGQAVGPITVVQTSGSAARAGRLAAFDGRPIPIVVRGLEGGRPVERTEYTRSIVRGLSAAQHWNEVERIFVEEAATIISNTGDAGYAMPADERLGAGVPASFPAKLTRLLDARFRRNGRPLTLLPCELVPSNGVVLRGLIEDIAARSGLGEGFVAWLREKCVFGNSLVDRIVSGAIEPAGAIAEPYALWAIEKQPGLAPPCIHPAVRMVDDLRVTERLKLFVLNLGHTCLAERWIVEKRRDDETVREILADPEMRAWLDAIYDEEVIPVLLAAGIAEAPAYRDTVIERFSNPFLEHRLRDIADSHATKKERRFGGIIRLASEVAPAMKLPRLGAMLGSGVK